MSNVWKAAIKSDVEGDTPQIITLRGTKSPIIARLHAERIANAQRQRVVRDWGEEHAPTMSVTDVVAVGEDNSPAGTFRPSGAKPIDLDRFTKTVSEKLGHGGERPDPSENAASRRARLAPAPTAKATPVSEAAAKGLIPPKTTRPAVTPRTSTST